MATTSPARIDDELYASAKLAGEVQSRSASQQVVHWARIGREIETSSTVAIKDIADVLRGSRSYDSVSVKEQAVVRAEWSARMVSLRETLNLAKEFTVAGRPWVELDDDGTIVERGRAASPSAGKRVVSPKAVAKSGGVRVRKGAGGDKPAGVAATRAVSGRRSGSKARTRADD